MNNFAPGADPPMLRRACGAAGLYALTGGTLSFGGWVLDISRLADWFGTGISIQPNTALCVVFCGLSLLLVMGDRRHSAALCGAGVALIGGLTLTQWLTGLSFGLDAVLLFDRSWGAQGVVFAGRMGPPASLSWTLIGIALALTAAGRAPKLASAIALTTASISALSLIGYLYGAEALFALPYVTAIALQTSTFIMAVSIGIIARHPEREPVRTLLDPGAAGILARHLLPPLLLVPIFLGFVRLEGEKLGLYSSGVGTSLLVVALMGFLAAVLWWPLRAVRAHEQQGRVSSAAELERRRDWEALVQAAPVAIWVALDPDCRVVKGNPAAAALMRLPAAANPSTTSTDAALHETAARVHIEGRLTPTAELPMQTAARTRRAVPNQELEFRFPDGSSNWAYGNAVPLFDAKNEVRGAISSFIDVTALKHAEQSLRDADRRKDEFLAVLAHELRNPLAPIRNAVAILRLKEPETPELQWARDVIDRQVVQMARLIDDLLDLSRISHGKIALKLERVELAAIVHAAVEGSRPLIDERRHELTVDVPEEPIYLNADPTRLAQSLCNLLNNAAKYTDRGGRIRLHAEQRAGEIIVSVRDSGIGIPAEMLSRVFEMFTQLDRASDRSQGGLGIGLTLVKRVVEMHDGQVEARSAGRGMGSEFVVRMPALEIVRCAPLAAQRRTADIGRSSRPPRVLVVDDNRDAADSLQIMLGMTGSEVRVAYDGAEAVRVAEKFQPNVVVLDLGMPGVDGYETARALRAATGGADVVLIAVTGWGQPDDYVRSKAAGFDYHLVKPVGADALVELLTSLPVRQELIA